MSPTQTNTIPEREQLGASTVNRKYYLDVMDPDDPGSWVGVFGIQESKPRPGEGSTQDDSDMDGEGYKSNVVTALTWGFDGKVIRKTTNSDPTAYDPGQEILRKVAERVGGRIMFRYYEMEPDGPRVEAKTGWGTVTWTPDGGNMESLDTVAITITGRGKPTSTQHPEAAPASAVVSSILPPNAETGAQVVISGKYFDTSAAADYVQFGSAALDAADVNIVSSSQILAKVPAGDAGPVVVTVGDTQVIYTRGS